MPVRRHAERGFTLTELLVVVAIIGVLIGLLVPGLRESRVRADKTYCRNNLRQLTMALMMYRDENEGKMPGWLSNLYPAYVSSNAAAYLCRSDTSSGGPGQGQYACKPEAVSGDTYPEASDNDSNGSSYGRNAAVQACSYLYEFNAAPCSWGWASLLGVASVPDVDGDGGVSSWMDVKTYQLQYGDTYNGHVAYRDTLFPVIRCFHHHAQGDVLGTDGSRYPMTLNASYAGHVFDAPLLWELATGE